MDCGEPAQWPGRVLLFDTETRTSIDQTFLFGIYRMCDLVDGQYRCVEEGVFHDELSKQERNVIRKFAANSFPEIEVPRFPPNVLFSLDRTLLDFVEHVFFVALNKGWLIAGFNLPFDISRLIVPVPAPAVNPGWRKTHDGGFSLNLSKVWWRKTKRWIANPYRPPIIIEPKDARTAFISRGRRHDRSRTPCT